ncbi:PH domain-containing protein [Nocardiopsis alba]|uniref:PH domain-containing protein n=1 Tax=Nocardiopsis TaxID=2013 RepID=UPI002DBAE735|nr:PH domain-containing protein [Nocardiopsis sp. LDBS1602]MEC3891472.1 PH domain-containing protein [Nocardiopsis sp. LDBS1602]
MTSHDDHRSGAPEERPEPRVDPIEDPAATEAPPIDLEEDWQRLSPLSVWANTAIVALSMVPMAIIGTVVLIVVGVPLWPWVPLPATAAFVALMTYLDLLRLRAIRYRITPERMEMRSGIVAKAYRSIPRERVRSVDVATPIYTRIFGLCSVTVGTGEKVGSGGDQMQLQYVTSEQGERLRRDLLQRGPAPASTGTGEPEGPEGAPGQEETELARLDPRWFAYAPATTATLGVGLGLFAALLGFNAQTNGWAWRWVSDQSGLPDMREMSGLVMSKVLLVVPIALFSLLVFGVVVLVAAAVETWWGYRLTRESDGTVRLRRGLLTNVSLSVEGRRLNGVVLREPFVLRSVRGASVQAVATGLETGDDKKTDAKSRLSPAMPRARARALGAALMGRSTSPLEVPLARHPRAALRRRFTRAGLVTLVGVALAAGLAWLQMIATEAWWKAVRVAEEQLIPFPLVSEGVKETPNWGWALVALAIAAMAFAYAVGSYRALGHGLHPDHLVMRRGMAVRDTVALERSAVIGWRITRSPFQRRLGLVDVSATTAAGKGMYTVPDVGLGQGLAWARDADPELLTPFLERSEEPPGGERATPLP